MQISKIQTTKFYKRLIIIFLTIALITLGVIIYFSFSKTTITVHLIPKTVSTIINTEVEKELTLGENTAAHKLSGFILTTTVSGSQTFINTNQGGQVEAQAIGSVTIYNNWSTDQPLMATTRLLTPEGILFRIRERVDVPAGSKIENIEVYADQLGASGNIGPATFSIPGLWPGLQDKIYAESTAPMTSGLREARTITQQIINETKSVLKGELINKAKKNLVNNDEIKNHQFNKLGQAVATIILEEESSAAEGEEATSFAITMKLKVIVVNIDENKLLNLALNKLEEELPSDEKLHETSNKTLSYNVEEYNLEDQTATLKVEIIAGAIPRSSSPILNKDNLTDKNSQEINTYFSNFDEVLSVNINFSPFWITTTPGLKENIELLIEEQ